jgi:hypothetical protein
MSSSIQNSQNEQKSSTYIKLGSYVSSLFTYFILYKTYEIYINFFANLFLIISYILWYIVPFAGIYMLYIGTNLNQIKIVCAALVAKIKDLKEVITICKNIFNYYKTHIGKHISTKWLLVLQYFYLDSLLKCVLLISVAAIIYKKYNYKK